LQGDADIVMSLMFGGMSPLEHIRMLYGPKGLVRSAERGNQQTHNCGAWVHPSAMHTFGLAGPTMNLKVENVSAKEFLFDSISRQTSQVFRSR
jgi:hypothetical protein